MNVRFTDNNSADSIPLPSINGYKKRCERVPKTGRGVRESALSIGTITTVKMDSQGGWNTPLWVDYNY
jgi:hypothetical protein